VPSFVSVTKVFAPLACAAFFCLLSDCARSAYSTAFPSARSRAASRMIPSSGTSSAPEIQ
jgi:hypothetical protein